MTRWQQRKSRRDGLKLRALLFSKCRWGLNWAKRDIKLKSILKEGFEGKATRG